MARHSVLIYEPGMGPVSAGQNRSFEHVFAAFDADLGIVDLDHLDEGLQICLTERNRSGGKVLAHAVTELLKQCGIDLVACDE